MKSTNYKKYRAVPPNNPISSPVVCLSCFRVYIYPPESMTQSRPVKRNMAVGLVIIGPKTLVQFRDIWMINEEPSSASHWQTDQRISTDYNR